MRTNHEGRPFTLYEDRIVFKKVFNFAKRTVQLSELNYKKAESTLAPNREKTQQALDQLGKLKVEIFTHQIKHLVSVVQQNKAARSCLAGYDEKLEIEKNLGMAHFEAVEFESIIGADGFVIKDKFHQAVCESIDYARKVNVAIAQIDAVNKVMEDIRTAVDKKTAVIMELTERFDKAKVDSVDDPGFSLMFEIAKDLVDVLKEPVLQEDETANPNISSQCSGYLEIGSKA